MPSVKMLERRIEADRAAVAASRALFKQAMNRKVGSTAGLATGFAAGLAGGWWAMAGHKRRRDQALRCPAPKRHPSEVRAKETKWDILRTIMMVSMPLWQKMLMPSAPPDDSH